MDNMKNHGGIENLTLDSSVPAPTIITPTAITPKVKASFAVDYLFWAMAALFLLRFAFKTIAANSQNALVVFIYSLTNPFVSIFQIIVKDISLGSAVIEFASIIAIAVLWLAYKAARKLVAMIK